MLKQVRRKLKTGASAHYVLCYTASLLCSDDRNESFTCLLLPSHLIFIPTETLRDLSIHCFSSLVVQDRVKNVKIVWFGKMVGNGGGTIGRISTETRFSNDQRRQWRNCWSGLSCFGSQKGRTRIVPASRIVDGSAPTNRANGPQLAGSSNLTTTISPSLLAPPSSPISVTNSALPSTAQSPNCYLSLSTNSPGGPSSTMFATGPYAHETQLVSPPVFSTYTTEPSTAPLTPPPEMNHLTTPSSPEVPFAHFLSSSKDLRNGAITQNGVPFMSPGYGSTVDLQKTYPLYPDRSPISETSREDLPSSFQSGDFPPYWSPPLSGHDNYCPHDDESSSNLRGYDPSLFWPSAQFYLDQSLSYPHYAGRLSLSKETDVSSTGGNNYQNQNRHKASKSDVEELEAYRASFGFSADEIIRMPRYAEYCEPDESFTISPFISNTSSTEEQKIQSTKGHGQDSASDPVGLGQKQERDACIQCIDSISFPKSKLGSSPNYYVDGIKSDEEDDHLLWRIGDAHFNRRMTTGLSSSDVEIDYGRKRSTKSYSSSRAWDI